MEHSTKSAVKTERSQPARRGRGANFDECFEQSASEGAREACKSERLRPDSSPEEAPVGEIGLSDFELAWDTSGTPWAPPLSTK